MALLSGLVPVKDCTVCDSLYGSLKFSMDRWNTHMMFDCLPTMKGVDTDCKKCTSYRVGIDDANTIYERHHAKHFA